MYLIWVSFRHLDLVDLSTLRDPWLKLDPSSIRNIWEYRSKKCGYSDGTVRATSAVHWLQFVQLNTKEFRFELRILALILKNGWYWCRSTSNDRFREKNAKDEGAWQPIQSSQPASQRNSKVFYWNRGTDWAKRSWIIQKTCLTLRDWESWVN